MPHSIQLPAMARPASLVLALLLLTLAGHRADTAPGNALRVDPNAVPLPAGSHLQLLRETYTWEDGLPPAPVAAVAETADGRVFVAAGGTLLGRGAREERWSRENGPAGVSSLYAPATPIPVAQNRETRRKKAPTVDALAAAEDGIWILVDGRWRREADTPVGATRLVAEPDGTPWAIVPAGREAGLWRRGEGGWEKVAAVPAEVGTIRDVAPIDVRTAYVAAETGLYALERSGDWTRLEPGGQEPSGAPAGGRALGNPRAVALLGLEHVLVGTEEGLLLSNGRRGWRRFTGAEGLPIESIVALCVDGDGRAWLATEQGLIRWEAGRFTYLAGPRWLPDDRITALAPGRDGVWIGTPKGLGRIYTRRMNLARKAEIYQRDFERRNRREGYVTVMRLRQPGVLEGAVQEISDNDGLWTALYVAAQSFRYGVNGSETARAQAARSLQALLRLESITGIPGFPARAISRIADPEHERRSPGEWHESTVEPGWMWKGDTSSDEIVGHFFAYFVYHELVADSREKEQIRATCKRIMEHILDHNFQLVDKDGQPTTWGVWVPEKLNDDPKWAAERGLNSLEILSHLRVAMHIVGDPRYEAAYRDLIRTHHYALNTLEAKVTRPGEINHSDDELEFLSWYPLLMLETDPGLRSIYMAGLRRTWEFERPEASPLWNFIYGACTGQPCDGEAAVQALREMPLDLIHWPVRNSVRADLQYAREDDRFGRMQVLRPLSWIERPMHKWNGNPYLVDGGDGLTEEDQTVWLLPYWLGRYHRIIE